MYIYIYISDFLYCGPVGVSGSKLKVRTGVSKSHGLDSPVGVYEHKGPLVFGNSIVVAIVIVIAIDVVTVIVVKVVVLVELTSRYEVACLELIVRVKTVWFQVQVRFRDLSSTLVHHGFKTLLVVKGLVRKLRL